METKLIKIEDLKFADYNPRTISKENFERLRLSIRSFGFTVPCTVNNYPGRENVLIAGHMRSRAAKEEGMTEVPCFIVSLDPQKERLLNIALNNQNLAGEYDEQLLAEMIVKLNDEDADIKLTGFDEEQISNILDDYMDTGNGDDDEAPEPEAGEPESKLGEIYELGPHRLMCGDSTSIADVEKLLNGIKGDMIFTDPPWNVDYGGGIQAENAQGYKPRSILNDKMTPEKWSDFVSGFVFSLKNATKPGAPIYLVMSAKEWPVIDDALRKIGFYWSSTIIWAKDRLVLSRKDYHTQYEPIWYGWNDSGPRIVEVADRKQSDVWEINRPSSSPDHPTTKPTELVSRAILNSSIRGSAILDLFGGSGSTLIAADKTGRTAYLMELDPRYCDVIRKRYQAYVEKREQK